MFYLTIIAICVLVLIVYLWATSKNKQERKLNDIRNGWGRPVKSAFNYARIGRYAAMRDSVPHKLSQQTLDDIDFNQLFEFIDRTTSPVGQQYLFGKLLHPYDSPADLARLHSLAEAMRANPLLREQIQLELGRLDQPDSYFICDLIHNRFILRPSWFKYLKVSLALVFALALLSIQFPICLIIMIIPLGINMAAHYWNKNNMSSCFSSFSQLNILINVSASIFRKSDSPDENVQSSLRNLKPFQWKLLLLNPESPNMADDLNTLSYYISDLFKAFFLVEVFTVFSLVNELSKRDRAISDLFRFIGETDTAISIASLRDGSLQTCQPSFAASPKEIRAKNLYHPLIRHCVRNDIHINGKSILITGSNMSGKTTFLRTLMINSILAQSIYTCFGDEFTTPVVRQFSSIRIDDNIFKGRSYFLEEVNAIGLLVEESQLRGQNLFVVDEVFKGTNSNERIALAKAILSYLNRGDNIVVVSTHDLELSEMLKEGYDLYHFSETIEEGELHFDHIIKPGPLKTTNAITLLEFANFPTDIITEARALSAGFTSGRGA
jgi:hypothetical protein